MPHLPRISLVIIALTCSTAAGSAWSGALADGLVTSCPLDERLNESASTALDHHEPIDGEQLRHAAEIHGVFAPSVRAWVGRGDEASVQRALFEWLRAQEADPAWSRCAVAHDGSMWALVMAPRTAVIAGVEPRVAIGSTSRYRIALPVGAADAELVIVQPDGSVERASAANATAVRFDARGRRAERTARVGGVAGPAMR